METVCVVGLGYVGLPTASLLATKGFKVHGVDLNPRTVDIISRGGAHIYEPDLDVLVKSAVQSGNLTANLKPTEADVFMIAVPTPFKAGYVPDISYIESSVTSLAPFLRPGNLVILESTSPVKTTELISDWLRELRPDLLIPNWRSWSSENNKGEENPQQIYLAHCPERVLPGKVLNELVNNDRIIGGIDRPSAQRTLNFYEKFVSGNLVLTDSRTAELCKLTENAYRDVNIAFANEISLICDKMGINPWELIELCNRHPRVKILKPGPGVGGHCIAVDPWFIVDAAPELAVLIRSARQVNDGKSNYIVSKVKEAASRLRQPVIACLGLSYKADIDDLRESPSVHIVRELADSKSGEILVVEPHVSQLPSSLAEFANVRLVTLDKALEAAHIVVALVAHKAFLNIGEQARKEKILVDAVGLWR